MIIMSRRGWEIRPKERRGAGFGSHAIGLVSLRLRAGVIQALVGSLLRRKAGPVELTGLGIKIAQFLPHFCVIKRVCAASWPAEET